MTTRNQVIEWINEVLRSAEFNNATSEKKDAGIDRMLEYPVAKANRISKAEILDVYLEILRSSQSFGQLNRDALYLVLARAQPSDVPNLCRTTPYLGRVCRDETVFIRLMELHYPDIPINVLNPKAQYLSIASNVRTYYYVHLNDEFANRLPEIFDAYASLLYAPPKQLGPSLVIPPSTYHILMPREMENHGSGDFHQQVINGFIKKSPVYLGATAEDHLPRVMEIDNGDDRPKTSYQRKVFYVDGIPLPIGTRVWVAYCDLRYGYFFYSAKDKEAIVRFMVRAYPIYLKTIRDSYISHVYKLSQRYDPEGEMAKEYDRVRNGGEVLDRILFAEHSRTQLWTVDKSSMDELIPFTEENFADFIRNHHYFRILGYVNHQSPQAWLFFPMEF